MSTTAGDWSAACQTSRAVWLSWNDSRRSRSLSAVLCVPLVCRDLMCFAFKRHAVSACWTVWQLWRLRPRVIFLQHSFLLTVIVALYASFYVGTRLIVDVHTKAMNRDLPGLRGLVFRSVRAWSMRRVELLLVANAELARLARSWGVEVMVVPDPLPSPVLGDDGESVAESEPYAVLVCSFARDEPWHEFVAAAQRFSGLRFRCTGRPPAWVREAGPLPENIELTGWLPDTAYWRLLRRACVVLVLTQDEACVTCGAAEAIAVRRPLILTRTTAQIEEFGEAATYVSKDMSDLAEALMGAASAIQIRRQAADGIAVRRAEAVASARERLWHRVRPTARTRVPI